MKIVHLTELFVESTVKTPALLAAAFGGETESYVALSSIAVGILLLIALVVAVVVIKRKATATKETSIESEDNSKTPNICMFDLLN